MTLGALDLAEVERRLHAGELLLRLGPLVARFHATLAGLASTLQLLHAEAEAPAFNEEVADLTLQLRHEGPHFYRWLVDGQPTDKPAFGAALVFANLEWALHYALSVRLAPLLAYHASVAARDDGNTVALIGVSGSGKSTLAAGLAAEGWTLVADEYLIRSPEGRIVPMPGPITLKSGSVELMRARNTSLRFGPSAPHDVRGEICQVATNKIARQTDDLRLAALIFPRFEKGAATELTRTSESDAFQALVEQSHNRHILGVAGFRQLCAVARLPSFKLVFGDLDAGLAAIRNALEQVA